MRADGFMVHAAAAGVHQPSGCPPRRPAVQCIVPRASSVFSMALHLPDSAATSRHHQCPLLDRNRNMGQRAAPAWTLETHALAFRSIALWECPYFYAADCYCSCQECSAMVPPHGLTCPGWQRCSAGRLPATYISPAGALLLSCAQRTGCILQQRNVPTCTAVTHNAERDGLTLAVARPLGYIQPPRKNSKWQWHAAAHVIYWSDSPEERVAHASPALSRQGTGAHAFCAWQPRKKA